MTKEGIAEVYFSAASTASTKITVIDGAGQAFIAAKPAGVLSAVAVSVDQQNQPDSNLITLDGLYTDADIAAWVAAAMATGFTGSIRSNVVDVFNSNYRTTIGPNTAVIYSRDAGVAFVGVTVVRYLGADYSEWT
jgi:hypothetical protein